MKSFKDNATFAGIDNSKEEKTGLQQASIRAEKFKSDRIVSKESLIRPQQNLNKEVERGNCNRSSKFRKEGFRDGKKCVMTNVKFMVTELGNPPICDRNRFIECMRVCGTYKRPDYDWPYHALTDYFCEEFIYLRMRKCPEEIRMHSKFMGLVKLYNFAPGPLYNKMMDIFVRRVLYNPAYHWKVVHSSINGYDSGLSDAFTDALLKLKESKNCQFVNHMVDFICKNYKMFCRCLVPAHMFESVMWKRHKCFKFPVIAQGLFGDFSKMIVKHMMEWTTSGKFLLDVSNDAIDMMRQIVEWIMNAIGIPLTSNTFFAKCIKTFCVVMVGALIVQLGQFSLVVVWSLMAAIMKIFLGAALGAVFTMMDLVNDCVAQGDSHVLFTLLNFGALAMTGVKMPVSGKLSMAKTGAPIIECLWGKIKEFINFCAKQLMGVEYLLGTDEIPALKKFIDELSELLSIPDIARKCVLDKNLMRKIQETHSKSIEIRKILLKTDCYDGPARTQIAILIAKLDNLFVTTMSTSSLVVNRPTPKNVYLCGPPGQGKTTSLDIIASGVHAYIMQAKLVNAALYEVLKDNIHFAHPYENYFKYARVLGSEYWEGYSGQWLVQYNEIFPNKSPLENAPTATELLMAVESCSFPLNMAFDLKGKNYFTSDFIIATSNRDTFENIGLATPEAFIRRLHFPITVLRRQTLKPDRSNLNEAWKMTVNFFPQVKGAREALELGLDSHLRRLHERKIAEGDGSFGVVELIEVIGQSMIENYLNPTIGQTASNMDWSTIFADHKRKNLNSLPKTSERLSTLSASCPNVVVQQCLASSLNESLAQGGESESSEEEDIECDRNSFEISDSDEEIPELGSVGESWSDYFKKKLGYTNYTVFHPVASCEVDVEDVYIGKAYVEAEIDSKKITAQSKVDLIDKLNSRPILLKHLVKTYYESPKHWFEVVEMCRANNLDITSNCLGFVDKVNVFGRIELVKIDATKPKLVYDFLRDSFIYYAEYQVEYNHVVVNKTFETWFDRVKKRLCSDSETNIFLAILGLGLASTLGYFGLKKLLKYVNETKESEDFEKIDNVVAHSPKKEALALNQRFKVAPRVISEAQGASTVEVDLVNRCNNILKNLRWCRLTGKRKVWTQILFGSPGIFVVPLHSWFYAEGVQTVEIQDMHGSQTVFYSCGQWEAVTPPNRDLIFIHLKEGTLPMEGVGNIVRSIPDSALSNVEAPIRLMRVLDEKTDKYTNMFFGGDSIRFETNTRNNVLNEHVRVPMSGYYVMQGGKGSAGMCSSPVITRDSRHQNTPLLGVHIGRYGEDSMIAPLYRSDFERIKSLDINTEIISTAHGLYMDQFTEELSDNVPQGTRPYFKPKKPSYMMQETELKKSILYPHLPPSKVAPAMLKKTGDIDPLAKAYVKYTEHKGKPINKWSASLMGENFNYLKMFYRLPISELEYKRLSFEEAVFGDKDTDNSIDGLDLNTSSGFPFVSKNYCPKRKDWFVDDKRTLELKKMVEDQIRLLEGGIYSPQIVIDQLKDELRENERVYIGKTRLFCVGSIVDCIITKMYLGAYLGPMKKHLYYSSACIGTNPHDMSWAMLFNRIDKWPEDKRTRWFGGDAGGYDYSIERWEIAMAYYYLRNTLPVPHINVKFWNVIKGLLYRIATTIHVSRDQSYICERRNSSGHWLTAWLNSFIMKARILACFLKRKPAGEHYETYEDMPISLVVYGDDNIGSVKKGVEWFDNLTLKVDMMELFDCQFTDPKKGEIQERFLDLPSQIFLARQFDVLDYSIVKAPLSIDSIMGMLYYVRGNTKQEQIDRLKQNVMTAMQELSHYKSEEQEIYYTLIRTAYEKTGYVWDFDSPEKWTLVRAERSSDAFLFCH